MVERAIFERRDLTAHQKLLLCYLAMRANSEAECWPSYATIARDCGISRRTAIKVVGELEDKGLLSRTRRRNEVGDFTSNLVRLFSADTPVFPEVGEGVGSSGAPDSPLEVVQEVHHPSAPDAPRVVQELHLNEDHEELDQQNYGVEVFQQADRVMAAAIARGVEITNPHAYRKGIVKNLVALQQEQQETQAVREEREQRRANCTSCEGMGMVELDDASWTTCAACSPVPA